MVSRPILGVAFLAPTPPPVMGPSIATQVVLSAPPPPDLAIHHIDTADRRSLATLGRIDPGNLWNAFSTWARLVWVLLARRPQLVYVPLSQTALGYLRDSLYLVTAWLARRRTVVHLRGGNFGEFYARSGRLLRWWVRWTLARTHGAIVLGECLKGMFAPFLPPQRIHAVPNGEDFPEFDGRPRAYPPGRGRQVVFLGNLLPLKGVGDLLRAVPEILARHPETRFSFAGEWRQEEFRAWAEGFVKERGLEARVAFPGPVDRAAKTRLLSEADLFVLPSTREGHPWVIVEALAAGLPVVSCDTGCVRESVIDGRNGRLVPMRDPAALARTVNELLADPAALSRMAGESRRHYEASYTRERFRSRLFDALRGAGGSGGGA